MTTELARIRFSKAKLRKVMFWDFDGTLAMAPSIWTGSVFKELSDTLPDIGIDIHQVRPLMQTGFPWHETQDDHRHLIPAGLYMRTADRYP
jgi:hypothetical protein